MSRADAQKNEYLAEMYNQIQQGIIVHYMQKYCLKLYYQYFIIKQFVCKSLHFTYLTLTNKSVAVCYIKYDLECLITDDDTFYDSNLVNDGYFNGFIPYQMVCGKNRDLPDQWFTSSRVYFIMRNLKIIMALTMIWLPRLQPDKHFLLINAIRYSHGDSCSHIWSSFGQYRRNQKSLANDLLAMSKDSSPRHRDRFDQDLEKNIKKDSWSLNESKSFNTYIWVLNQLIYFQLCPSNKHFFLCCLGARWANVDKRTISKYKFAHFILLESNLFW